MLTLIAGLFPEIALALQQTQHVLAIVVNGLLINGEVGVISKEVSAGDTRVMRVLAMALSLQMSFLI